MPLNALRWFGVVLYCWVSTTVAASQVTPCEQRDVVLLTAKFDTSTTDQKDLGQHVASTIALQVWQLLWVPPDGRLTGGVTWDLESLAPRQYDDAETVAEHACEDPQFVVWGRTWSFGAAYLMEPRIAIREPKSRARRLGVPVWSIARGGAKKFEVNLPHRELDFEPLVLDGNVLRDLKDPAKLPLYDVETCSRVVDTEVGPYFKARERVRRAGKDFAVVHARNGRKPDSGCIQLEQLSFASNNLVRMSGGLIAFFRNDWDHAGRLLLEVAQNASTGTVARIDAYLYLGVIAERQGKDPLPWVEKAAVLNPYDRSVVQYLCMAHLWNLGQAESRQDTEAAFRARSALRKLIAGYKPAVAGNDSWFMAIEKEVNGS